MSSYIKKFSHLKLHELIEICDSCTDYYSKKAKEAAFTIIELKEPDHEDLKQAAILYWNNRIEKEIKNLLKQNHIPTSSFLNKEDIKEIMKTAFKEWKAKQELMGVDTSKYWALPF